VTSFGELLAESTRRRRVPHATAPTPQGSKPEALACTRELRDALGAHLISQNSGAGLFLYLIMGPGERAIRPAPAQLHDDADVSADAYRATAAVPDTSI
jgi:hypothetical protein